MKLKDITNCSERWATPLGTMDGNAAVAEGVLVDLYWGTSIIGLAVQCPDGKYAGDQWMCLKCLSACLDFDSRQAPQPLILTHPLLLPGEQI
jgi:hypothetical protein